MLVGQFSAASIVAWASAIVAAAVLATPIVRVEASSEDGVRSKATPSYSEASLILFMTLCALLVADLVVSAPLVGNHQMIIALGSLLLLAAWCWAAVTRASGMFGGWADAAIAGLRWLLLLAYGLIAFSKLNSDYLNPVVSCAVVFSNEMSEWFGLSVSDSKVASGFAIYGSLLTELSVPVLLSIRRLRSVGVLLALGFHGFLSLEPVGHVYDFTAVLIPFFLLFAPVQVQQILAGVVGRVQSRLSPPMTIMVVLVVLLGNLIAVGAGLPIWVIGFTLWLVYGVVLCWLVVPLLVRSIGRPSPATERPLLFGYRLAPPVLAVLALALANGMAPYLQLKTATAFNMYSNLRVLGEESNHVIVPATVALRTPELQMVATVDSDDPLSFYSDAGLALPRENLVRYLKQSEGEDVVDLVIQPVDGVTEPRSADEFLRLALDDGEEMSVSSTISRLFGLRRAVDVEGPSQCLRLWGPAY